jgi:hypothetical protein
MRICAAKDSATIGFSTMEIGQYVIYIGLGLIIVGLILFLNGTHSATVQDDSETRIAFHQFEFTSKTPAFVVMAFGIVLVLAYKGLGNISTQPVVNKDAESKHDAPPATNTNSLSKSVGSASNSTQGQSADVCKGEPFQPFFSKPKPCSMWCFQSYTADTSHPYRLQCYNDETGCEFDVGDIGGRDGERANCPGAISCSSCQLVDGKRIAQSIPQLVFMGNQWYYLATSKKPFASVGFDD